MRSTAINYRTDDFVAATLAATDGRGVDAILDVVGADYLERNLNCLAIDGHLVIIGGNLTPTPLNLGHVDIQRCKRHRDNAPTPFHPAES